ncbi:glycosyltransferase involved in cell wall biosynthesis [Homoserinimonas aerilata]|uniref:Glycosyltransferase involved in cell wall biosynthesis n=1 Tax=Homoserinimonas aerilata TaxID=1162970 RepID=A0A542YL55_9MICO|nr:glycosyltransferase family 1 protein [Homoserinimonas aerilata]TQL48664.1 glycosyltransferase involved in cell wall biosynthesis [Homoserinimonas aerilata]
MSTTLRVIVDPIVAPVPGGIGRYTEELTRKLIETAPPGCDVTGIVSATVDDDHDRLETLLPGMTELIRMPLPRRELALAWRAGLTALPGRTADGTWRRAKAMVHSTTPLAPLGRHDRLNEIGNQTVVTVHDIAPWTHPGALSPGRAALYKSMVKRAHRYADAVVTPTHAVANLLNEIMDFGDRIRVIGGAVSSKLKLPVDADARAEKLGLPEQYILTTGTLEPRKRLDALIASLSEADSVDLPLLITGPTAWGGRDAQAVAAEAGLPTGRVRTLGYLDDADLAVILDRATVFAYPSVAEGFGLSIVEAFSLGTPVVHADTASLVEVAAGAGIAVPHENPDAYPRRLAQVINSVVTEPGLAERLRYQGLDRAKAFSWADSAQKVWQLHADL